MNLLLVLALCVALQALIRCRKLEKQLAVERKELEHYRRLAREDFRQNMKLAEQHDRLLGEKNNLQELLDARGKKLDRMTIEWARESTALRAELRRRHRKVRGV